MFPDLGKRSRIAVLVGAWAVVVAVLVGLLANAQSDSRRQINERFALRAEIASRFVTTYVDDLVERQRIVAERRLAGRRVGERVFQRTVADGGFEAAVLLDRRGRLLRVAPSKPELLGRDMTVEYEHLRFGTQGRVAISKVVPSAARGVPVVAFAVPFESRRGRRVYSGAYDVATTPLGAYLRNAIQITPNRVLLVDTADNVVAENTGAKGDLRSLRQTDGRLAEALRDHDEGSYESPDGEQRYATRTVDGTPWRVVIAVPERLLYSSIGGIARWLPWLALAGFALGGLLVLALLARLLESRARLAAANVALDRLSRVDPLTGLHNRRHVEEALAGLVSAGQRHDIDLSVLLIDADHFKRINDTYGHQLGDDVLRAMAEVIRATVRMEDVVARWGGEEFLVVLPGIGERGAAAVAQRMRASMTAVPIEAPNGAPVNVTVTIGIATWQYRESVGALLDRADGALYRGKERGRDRVEVAQAVEVSG